MSGMLSLSTGVQLGTIACSWTPRSTSTGMLVEGSLPGAASGIAWIAYTERKNVGSAASAVHGRGEGVDHPADPDCAEGVSARGGGAGGGATFEGYFCERDGGHEEGGRAVPGAGRVSWRGAARAGGRTRSWCWGWCSCST